VHEFVWLNENSRNITTAFITEKSPPVPKPLLNELMDIQKLNIIKDHPQLFHITTPIHINCFCNLLAAHSNRPLVNSVCEGLEHSFWPWAVTHESNAPPIVDNAHLQKVRDPIHLLFVEEQRDDWQLVVNHSADNFSPNSFISPVDASVHLDSLHTLGKALLDIRDCYGKTQLVLLKTDVSQVY
jgi:hypothetical protein